MPTRILALDISNALEPIALEKGYDRYHILVRIQHQPLGWLTFLPDNSGSISAEQLQQAIKEQLSTELIRHSLISSHILKNKAFALSEGVSVVVCTRNRTQQLKHCLQALLAMSYPNYEIIVIDNAPDNNDTLHLTETLPVRYIREEQPGLDRARNRGITEAQYSIIAFTDDDALVDRYWLQTIASVFQNKKVMGVSGYVAPAELETKAQQIFEWGYGGMGHGLERRFLRKEYLTEKQLLWASSFGIGANMAFRREIFYKTGYFDTALDVGTPSHGGGDIELFHRLVNNGYLFVYEPCMIVWHYHRKDYKALCRQIYNNGCSFGCFLINCLYKKTVRTSSILQFFILDWLFKWNLNNLIHPNKIPIKLSLLEFYGMLSSPLSYWKTKTEDKKVKRLMQNAKCKTPVRTHQ